MEHQQVDKDASKEVERKMLSESGYSDKAIRYFQDKENIGVLANADQLTDLTGPCGDTMRISLSIEDNTIQDARIQVMGCPGAVASGCALVSLAKGKSLEEAKGIELEALYKELEKMPDQKVHCARLAIKTIASCGTFHVIDGFAGSIDDKSNIEDFIVPLTVPQAAEALLNADKVHYL